MMEKEEYFLPDPDKQKVAAKVLFDNLKVPNIVVVGDETLFPLAFQPEWDNHTNFNGRKGKYIIACMVVNNH